MLLLLLLLLLLDLRLPYNLLLLPFITCYHRYITLNYIRFVIHIVSIITLQHYRIIIV